MKVDIERLRLVFKGELKRRDFESSYRMLKSITKFNAKVNFEAWDLECTLKYDAERWDTISNNVHIAARNANKELAVIFENSKKSTA